MKRTLCSSLVLISALTTGCATTARGVALGDAAEESLRLEGGAITGPSSTLSITENAMHGRYRRDPVSLEWDYQKMTGSVGYRATRLELAEGDDTRVWGTFGGMTVDLTEDGTYLHGRVGPCAYVLKREGDTLTGVRECGSALEKDVTLAFPATLHQRPLGERAALMTLALVNTRAPLVTTSMTISSLSGGDARNEQKADSCKKFY
ncbi:hypothetical protein HUA74_11285 [Myxococcus sp. CA051A]|uniref:hypothetical protein n=1 Tax=unclassified Myxococcus TaxID=2648731 RepID=UPI00157A6FF8|nr:MULTISPECIES: hypothetical protein [unclassified Myxococcus]NTX09334.1 hypothetical protein [Myxococcus sp. CA056]NTX37696.1 hypothetical protein [Myxococcus sp. CA033]NTX53253.1 hypothetical protein [Myxococcus sp. CA039A]NTX61248.1 hypothetical protein [Myxococcus sp. CA051A]